MADSVCVIAMIILNINTIQTLKICLKSRLLAFPIPGVVPSLPNEKRQKRDSPSSDLEHLTAFGLQVDDDQVVTFSYTIEGEADVEGNRNGYICEADGTFQFRSGPIGLFRVVHVVMEYILLI